MKIPTIRFRIGLSRLQLAVVLACLSLPAQATANVQIGNDPTIGRPPRGLSSSDWTSIRAAYEAGRHAIHRIADGTFAARNPSQQWRAAFDGRGFLVTPDHGQWTWGLELTGYGNRSLPHAPCSIRQQGEKMFCQRDKNLTEWFVNDARGLEQGWTILGRPEGMTQLSPLHLQLSPRGPLRPEVTGDGSCVSFLQQTGGVALTYGGLKAWDADGRSLPVRFELVHERYLRIAVDEHDARYPITIDPIAQQAYLKASNVGAGDQFGGSVAISGDTVVVGARGESSSATGVNEDQTNNNAGQSGAAYVFVRNGTSWTQQAYLKASNTGNDDAFGISVAISGDTVVVGASLEDSSAVVVNGLQGDNFEGNNAGAAYVFVRTGSTWTQQAYLKANVSGWFYQFGTNLAISGDTVVAGNRSNHAYVFVRTGVTWALQADIPNPVSPADTFFGSSSQAISGDTLVIGASGESSNATGVNGNQADTSALQSGAAYVFTRNGTVWSQQAYLKASNTGAGDYFGASVAISGDTVVVGAPGEDSHAAQTDNGSPDSGAAYVFVRNGATWAQQAFLKAGNVGSEDGFGSVAISGHTIVVGAWKEDSTTTGINSTPNDAGGAPFGPPLDTGAAYVFSRNGSAWTQMAYIKAGNTAVYFGGSVAISADTVIIGARSEHGMATNSGAAYVFDGVDFSPNIAVEIPVGTPFADGGTLAFGSVDRGAPKTFPVMVRNDGNSQLADLAVTLDGTNFSHFSVSPLPVTTLAPGDFMVFNVTFAPRVGAPVTAALHIASNDPGEPSFDLALTGNGTSTVSPVFVTPQDFPWRNSSLNASALTFGTLTIHFVPTPGIALRVFNNTGTNPVTGHIVGLPDGGTVTTTYNGVTYAFVATYTGGDGNDIVLISTQPGISSRILPSGDYEITFTGILQSSPNLLPASWQDVTPQPSSPYAIPKASLGSSGFFRARGQ